MYIKLSSNWCMCVKSTNLHESLAQKIDSSHVNLSDVEDVVPYLVDFRVTLTTTVQNVSFVRLKLTTPCIQM